VVVGGVLAGPAAAQLPTLPPDGGTRLASPTCTTLDLAGRPRSDFRAGDELILRGAGYPPGELVLVTFQQPPHSAELARFKTSLAGDFTSEPTILRVPADAAGGSAEIRVASSGGSSTCPLNVTALTDSVASASREPAGALSDAGEGSEGTPAWLIVWATIVGIGGAFLALVAYRRWQAQRLEQTMARLGPGSRAARPAAPPRLEDLDQPPRAAEAPPVLPVGWDRGREPVPRQDLYRP
jgi:hypothetical protein